MGDKWVKELIEFGTVTFIYALFITVSCSKGRTEDFLKRPVCLANLKNTQSGHRREIFS